MFGSVDNKIIKASTSAFSLISKFHPPQSYTVFTITRKSKTNHDKNKNTLPVVFSLLTTQMYQKTAKAILTQKEVDKYHRIDKSEGKNILVKFPFR